MPINDADFFKHLAGEKPEKTAPSAEEIVFRDEAGKMKVLRGGRVFDFETAEGKIAGRQAIKEIMKPAAEPEPAKSPEVLAPLKPRAASEKIPVALAGPVWDYAKLAEIIIKKSGVNLLDEAALRRLKNIIVSRLRNVRDQMETREILSDAVAAGGFGLAAALVDKILSLINIELSRLDKQRINSSAAADFKSLEEMFIPFRPKEKIEETQLRPLPPLPEKSLAQNQSQKAEEPISFSPAPDKKVKPVSLSAAEIKELAEIAAVPLEPVNKKPPFSVKAESRPIVERMPEIKVDWPPVLAATKPSVPETKAEAPVLKIKPKEVKFQERLVDPVDEIRTMKVVDFRRLAPTPAEATKKISEKIALLEKDSFTKKIQGIGAWKENEIYQLYLAIVRQGILENKSMPEVVEQRQQANSPILTEEELEAILALNQRLRY